MTPPLSRVTSGPRRWLPRSLEGRALLTLLLFTVVAVLGYWNFGLHPERLPAGPLAARVYQVSFPLFARAQILIAAAVLVVVLARHAGWRWLPAFAVAYAISFLAEHVGTGYGVPFSGYGYTGLLGPKLLGRVPVLIPVSWFLMSSVSWVVARARAPRSRQAPTRIVLASGLLVTWDLALDPAMSHLTPYWIWESKGAFYGMPWVNLLGWFVTGLVLMTALELLDRRLRWSGSLPASWAAGYYGAVLLMPLGMVAAAGLWLSVGATVTALALHAVVLTGLRPSPATDDAPDASPPHRPRPRLAPGEVA